MQSRDEAQEAVGGVRRGALHDVRVLDLTWGMPGAVTGMLLADSGAEVIRIERPGPVPVGVSGTGITWDRDKRSVIADLHDPDDAALVRELAAGADIVLGGLRRGVLDGVGLGAVAVRIANPAVVYCSFLGDRFDPRPELGNTTLAEAKLGIMGISPGHRDGPIFPGHRVLGYSTAAIATIGILASLHDRIRTSRGDHVEVSHTEGYLALTGMNWLSDRGVSVFKARERTGYLDFGRLRQILRIFECSDGRSIQVHTFAAGAFVRALEGFGLENAISPTSGVHQFDTELTEDDVEILQRRLPEIIAAKPSDYWLERLWASDVACLPLQPPGEALRDEQVTYAGVVKPVDLPGGDVIDTVGPLLRLSDSPCGTPIRVHDRGEDGDAVRADGWSAAGLARIRTEAQPAAGEATLPLAGVNVVDLCSWFAGPYGARLLADLGATVVKIEPLIGDPIRGMADPSESVLRGKQSLSIDLKNDAATEVVARLCAQADVIQTNVRPGVAERLGVDYETVRALNPRLIYNFAPGYGSTGPKAHLQSFAPLLSGFTGVNHMSGGAGNKPCGFFGNEDYYNAFFSVIGVLTALIHRDRSGRGQYVETPQLYSSLLYSSEWHLRDGKPQSSLPTLNSDQTGFGPFMRMYQCLTGWVVVSCISREQQQALVDCVLNKYGEAELVEPIPTDSAQLSELLQYSFFFAPEDVWKARLDECGVPAEIVVESTWLPTFLSDKANAASERVYDMEHPLFGRIRTIGSVFYYDDRPAAPPRRSPLLGEHTRVVLLGLGFTESEVDDLAAHGVVREFQPAEA